MSAARPKRRPASPPVSRVRSKVEAHSAEPAPPHFEADHFEPLIPTHTSQAVVTPPPSLRHARWKLQPSTRETLTAAAWGVSCIGILAGSMSGDSSLPASARFLYYGLLLSALLVCRLAPFERRAPALLADFYRAWLSLPLPLLACALVWLLGLAIAIQTSIVPFLSVECSQLSLSIAIAGALIFGYAAHGPREVDHVVGGLIAALDVAIAAATVHLLSQTVSPTSVSSQNQFFAVLFACALPLAWNEAARASEPTSSRTRFKVLWLRAEAVYRRVRPGIMLGLVLAAGPSGAWIVFLAAWTAHLVSRTRGFIAAGATPRSPRILQFYFPTLFNGFLICCLLTAWAAWQAAPELAVLQSTNTFSFHFDFATMLREMQSAFFERPWFGSGQGSFTLRVQEIGRAARSSMAIYAAPNSWLRALLESGLVATLAALGACCFIFVRALPTIWHTQISGVKADARTVDTSTLLASGLALAVASCVFDLSRVPFLGFLAATILALLAARSHTLTRADAPPSPKLFAIKRAILNSVLLITGLWLIAAAPRTWRSLQAHRNFERAQNAGSVAGRFEELLQARDREPDNAFYWAQLGVAKYQLGGPPVARASTNFMRQAAHRAPHDALWWHNLGALYLIANDYPQAIHNFNRAVDVDPNWWITHLCLAHALERQGERKRSREERNVARLLWSKYFDPGTRASLAGLQASAHGRIYRRAAISSQIIMPPALLADREFFVVN